MNTKIKVKAKNVIELLRLLEQDSNEVVCTLEMDLDISKTIVKILDNYSEDWDFISYSKPTEVPINENPIQENKQVDEEIESSITYYLKKLGVKDYNSLATLVESIYELYKQSPNIKFESGLFCNTLEAEYLAKASSQVTIEHSLLAMIIESYYGKDVKIQEALEDTVGKLRGMWISKELSGHPNTTSLTKILYGGK